MFSRSCLLINIDMRHKESLLNVSLVADHFFILVVSIGIQYTFSISSVATMYYSLSLRSLFGFPILFLIVVRIITYLTLFPVSFPTSTKPRLFFREVHFSGSKSTIRVYHRVVFWYPKSFKKIVIDWLHRYHYFTSYTELPFSVKLYFWWCNKDIIMTYLWICCWLCNSNKDVYFSYSMYHKLISASIIFLFGTWYIYAAALGVDVTWNKYI